MILTNKPVARLIIENGKCTGVECLDGSAYRADKAVLSTIHIKHLVDMAPKELWGTDFVDGVDTWQPEFQMMSTNYATSEPIKYPDRGWHAFAGAFGIARQTRTRAALCVRLLRRSE